MRRRADNLSDQTLRDRRLITATGRVIGTIPTRSTVTLLIQLPADAEVEIHPQEQP